MRLWYNTTKRIAKKKMGKNWAKLNSGKDLGPGDLITTCKGYNERIEEITPVWNNYGLAKGEYVSDFDIITESGGSCSLIHCCIVPARPVEEILNYWLYFTLNQGREWLKEVKKNGWSCWDRIPEALLEGKEVFDKDGQPLYEFCQDYEKQARFPEQWATEVRKADESDDS